MFAPNHPLQPLFVFAFLAAIALIRALVKPTLLNPTHTNVSQ